MNRKVRLALQMGAIVVGVGGFAVAMYLLYAKRYDESHPVALEGKGEKVVRTTMEEHRVLPTSTDKPPIDALVRERMDYAHISQGYSQGERITTETTNIVKDARGTDKGRDAIEGAPDISEVIEIVSANLGDKKAELLDMDDEALKDDVVVPPEHAVTSNQPFGKTQAELAMRFSVIDEFEFTQTGSEYYQKRTVQYFVRDQLIAGFNDDLVEIADDDLLNMAYTMVEVKGLSTAYVRDVIEDIDYRIVRRDGDYMEAYEDWVTGREEDE